MKKVLNLKNIVLLLIIVLTAVLTMNTKEVKAAGTVTWSGPSSITIRETISNITNPIVATEEYFLTDENWDEIAESPKATITYTASDTLTNYQITKSAVLNLSSLTFDKAGDYQYGINSYGLSGSSEEISDITGHFDLVEDVGYGVIVSVRNVVDANNIPTGNFTASLILQKFEYNEQTDDYDSSKVTPSSGVLYADFTYEASPYDFGHIELTKTVKGIGADTTKYFPFTISINNHPIGIYNIDTNGWTYPITGIDSTVTYNGSTISNPTTITVGTPTTIYLKHGQTAIIGQVTNGGNTFSAIPFGFCWEEDPHVYPPSIHVDNLYCAGSYFTVEETPGDYTPAFSVNGESSISGYYVPATGVSNEDNLPTVTVDFSNTKTMSPVTGLVLTILPYLILAAIGVGGTLLVMHLKNEEKKAKA